jgi:hypothetical protein
MQSLHNPFFVVFVTSQIEQAICVLTNKLFSQSDRAGGMYCYQ